MTVPSSFRARALMTLRSIFNDALYRGSLILLTNTVTTSAIGLVFWTLAARRYPAATVGVFASVTSGVGLLAAIAALGLSNTAIRRVAGADNPREIVAMAVTAIVTVGTALCLLIVLILGPVLPSALHLQQHGRMALLVTALVVVTAVGGTLDACLVAFRSSHAVLLKNLVGSLVKVAALVLLTTFRASGLLISYSAGLVLATMLSGVALSRRIGGEKVGLRSFRKLPRYLSMTSGNYVATIMGIVPSSIVPFEVLVVRGAAETARFAVAFLIAGFLNFIPSTIAQVLFAETSRQGVTLGRQLRKAIRGVYGLVLPAVAAVVAAAPLLLRLFGTAYVPAAACLRILALSALLTGGTYLIDSLLIARDRTGAYIFMNGANAALVVGCVALLLPRGLAAAAAGWALAQGLSLLLGLAVLATGTAGRHHSMAGPVAGHEPQASPYGLQYPEAGYSFERQIRELLAVWPMMPTTMIADSIGWDQSVPALLDRVARLRSAYSYPYQDMGGSRYLAGQVGQCALWFPPTEVPVGSGQTRSARQLPVLTMITGYSRWLSAILLPSAHSSDLSVGLWDLLMTLGAIPRVLTWAGGPAPAPGQARNSVLAGRCRDFLRPLGVNVVDGQPANPDSGGLIEQAHLSLEQSFLPARSFTSPADFNRQLRDWLQAANTWPCQPPYYSPAELISRDKQAMLQLPPVPPPAGWRRTLAIGGNPGGFHFDANDYALPPAMAGRRVELVADLEHVRVFCDGRAVAGYDRSWARGQIIGFNASASDPVNAADCR